MPEKWGHREITVQPSLPVSSSVAGAEFPAGDADDITFVILATAGSGSVTPKLQFFDTLYNNWIDVPGGVTAAITAVGQTIFLLGQESAVANTAALFPPTQRMRWFFTYGSGPITFAISAHMRLRG